MVCYGTYNMRQKRFVVVWKETKTVRTTIDAFTMDEATRRFNKLHPSVDATIVKGKLKEYHKEIEVDEPVALV